MQQAFMIVIFGVVIIAVLIAVVTLGSSGSAWRQIGANGLHDGSDRPASEPSGGAGLVAVRDEEARQMLRARNARRVRQGKEPLDVERELAQRVRTPAGAPDPQLLSEMRELVTAHNRRRVKQGKEPLDVESEVVRRLSELG